MADTMTLPMLGSIQLAPISSHQMKRIMAQLSGQQERLATDLPYFKQQTGVMLQAAVHLCSDRKVCKQLLRKEPQLLPQLVALNTAAMQQLAVQLDKDMDVSRAAAVLANTLGVTLSTVRARDPNNSQTPCPADTANLTMLQEQGGYVVSLKP